jgi:hypothetical protein
MKVTAMYTKDVFVPYGDIDLKDGDYQLSITKPRNLSFHKKFFALLNVGFQNQDFYANFEDFKDEIKLKTGFFKKHYTLKGNIIYFPLSIAFNKMDEIEFEELYEKTITVLIRDIIAGLNKEDLENAVEQIINFA